MYDSKRTFRAANTLRVFCGPDGFLMYKTHRVGAKFFAPRTPRRIPENVTKKWKKKRTDSCLAVSILRGARGVFCPRKKGLTRCVFFSIDGKGFDSKNSSPYNMTKNQQFLGIRRTQDRSVTGCAWRLPPPFNFHRGNCILGDVHL